MSSSLTTFLPLTWHSLRSSVTCCRIGFVYTLKILPHAPLMFTCEEKLITDFIIYSTSSLVLDLCNEYLMMQLLENSNLLCKSWLHYRRHNSFGVLMLSHSGRSDCIWSFLTSGGLDSVAASSQSLALSVCCFSPSCCSWLASGWSRVCECCRHTVK